MTQSILIIGATGRFGRNAAHAFREAGWDVRKYDRGADDLDAAMQGIDIVLNAANPPGYHHWPGQLVPFHTRVAQAAARARTTVILPGNVYVYGPKVPSPWTAETPHLATNELGRLRIEAEAAYPAAGARLIILRCGDFIDGADTGNWFETHIAKSVGRGFIRYPGDPTAPHAWAYLPDAAGAAVALAEIRDMLAPVEDVPFEGYTLSGNALASTIGKALGREIGVKRFNWAMIRFLKPFMPMLRGVFEMRYLWSLPHRLDGTKLRALVPGFVPTPPEEALRRAVSGES